MFLRRITLFLQQLISSLHDICQYLCAHARLGSSHARLGSQKLEFSGVTADWGGTEGIGKCLKANRVNVWKRWWYVLSLVDLEQTKMFYVVSRAELITCWQKQ